MMPKKRGLNLKKRTYFEKELIEEFHLSFSLCLNDRKMFAPASAAVLPKNNRNEKIKTCTRRQPRNFSNDPAGKHVNFFSSRKSLKLKTKARLKRKIQY